MRRRSILAAAPAILLLALCGRRWRAYAAPAQTTQKGTKKMNNAVIATFPTAPAFLSGQALRVRTLFDNRGSEPVNAPASDQMSAYVYILRSQIEGGPEYGLSALSALRRRSPDKVGTPEPRTELIPGGRKVEREEDIADLWNEGFAPGKYWLTVRYNAAGMESTKSELAVLPLVVESMSSFVSDGHLSTVIAHRRTDGQVTLLQRESRVRDPREGVFEVRTILPMGSPVVVATAIDVVPAGSGRWFAWLRDGKLAAINGWGNKIIVNAQPVAADGSLLSPGFQIAVGSGFFATVSTTGHIQTFLVTAAGIQKHWSGDLGSGAAPTKVLWNCQSDRSVTVAWEELDGRVMSRSFDAAGKAAGDAPRVITPGRPLAWGLAALGTPTIWAVVSDRSEFVVARIGPGGDRVMTRLPALTGVVEWDLCEAAPGGSSTIAALTDEKIYSARLDQPAWSANSATVRQARAMHIVSLNGRTMWAEWIEAGFGMRRAKLS
jgi:hypothetical protein